MVIAHMQCIWKITLDGLTTTYGYVVMDVILAASKLSKVHQTSLVNTLTVMLLLIFFFASAELAAEVVLKKEGDNSNSVPMFKMNREYPTDCGYFPQTIVFSDLKAHILR